MVMIPRVLIIEDEAPARASLKQALNACQVEHTVVGEARGRDEAIAMIDRLRPDMLLLDIRLGDGTGFEVLERTQWKDVQVIFITAYDQYAIRAFRCAAVDYLLKPVNVDLLGQSLRRAVASKPQTIPVEVLLRNLARPEDERIAVHCAEGIHLLTPRSIVRCEADGNYTQLFTAEGERLVTARTLKDFEELLAPHRFERVHMSHLVNFFHVRKFLYKDGGFLVLSDGVEVPVSQRRRQQVVDTLGRA